MPRILFIGDIFGRPGRAFVNERLPSLRQELEADFVIANAENAAGGAGVTTTICHELRNNGVDAVTLGDHVWDQRGFGEQIGGLDWVSRPYNLAPQCPGQRVQVVEKDGFRLGIVTLLGRTFMKMPADCPFRSADEALKELAGKTDAVFVEIHAETTSEKIALGWYLDGRACAVIGTHTHVATADAVLRPRGTAYLTDAGMTGPHASVIGTEPRIIIARFLDGMPRRYSVSEGGDVRLCGALVEVEADTGLAASIERVEIVREMPVPVGEAESDEAFDPPASDTTSDEP